jgi:hypothetical protein
VLLVEGPGVEQDALKVLLVSDGINFCYSRKNEHFFRFLIFLRPGPALDQPNVTQNFAGSTTKFVSIVCSGGVVSSAAMRFVASMMAAENALSVLFTLLVVGTLEVSVAFGKNTQPTRTTTGKPVEQRGSDVCFPSPLLRDVQTLVMS